MENFIKLSEKSQKGVVKFIWTLAGGVECEKYNDQIMNMTTNAGYILVDHGSQAGRQFDFNGVVVAVRGPHEFPPFFVTILNSMNEIGVSVKGGFDANLTSEEVLIWVGPKD